MYRYGKIAVGLACACVCLVPVFAQDDRPEGDDEMAAMMAEIMKYATPGEHHEHLKPLAGRWELATKFRMDADAPWDEGTGESVIEWILGGRFLQQKVMSPPTEEMPMPFEGFGLMGYDNLAKKHINLWTDNFLTGVMFFTGSCDASGKVVTLSGEFQDPKKSGEMTKERWVYRIINNNKFVFEMWQPGMDGRDFLHGEITYTRVQ